MVQAEDWELKKTLLWRVHSVGAEAAKQTFLHREAGSTPRCWICVSSKYGLSLKVWNLLLLEKSDQERYGVVSI